MFLERRERREKKRERNINVRETHQSVASHTAPTRVLACNPGMCPDTESNRQRFGSQASIQFTEPHRPRLTYVFLFLQIEQLFCKKKKDVKKETEKIHSTPYRGLYITDKTELMTELKEY